ncbi:MAG: superoxide dismutase [Candidatus Latescibacteria bacterium]|jgi:nickel superoxide dismutase|nr:superoxide dismutase [Candidatus Latescibacterota bacterium]MBT5832192.1 superoxide dismutase [Candidatus Latescibacterota bacterium]
MKRFVAVLVSVMLMPTLVLAHCEIPCGIYGDEGRFATLLEDVTTIEKSMKMIEALSKDGKDFNQIVRWVNNKEKHADHIREVVSQYFLAQRIKEPAEGDVAGAKAYTAKLVKLHQIIRTAMKCKQTTDVANAQKLHDQIHEFQELYNAK